VLVVGGLALALLVAIGGRLAVRALVLAAERETASTIAAPLMPALGALFALFMGLALIVNAAALTMRSGWRSALLAGRLAAVIGLSLALLSALGAPWRGTITVSGQPATTAAHVAHRTASPQREHRDIEQEQALSPSRLLPRQAVTDA
jgi:hypothetical protein